MQSGSRRFFALLGIILVVAFGVRVAYVLGEAQNDERFYDAAYYELQARALIDGHGYVDPFQFLPGASHRSTPAADHPPLTVFAIVPVMKAGDILGLDAEDTQLLIRFETAIVGLGVVLLIGLLGRELAGDRTGLIAAGIAAIYPYLWVNDGLLMSEAFAAAAVTGALLLMLKLLRRPSLSLALGARPGVRARGPRPRGADLARTAPRRSVVRELPFGRVVTSVRDRRRDRDRRGPVRWAVGRFQPQSLRQADVHLHERRHRDARVELRRLVLRIRDRAHGVGRLHPEAGAAGATSRWCPGSIATVRSTT